MSNARSDPDEWKMPGVRDGLGVDLARLVRGRVRPHDVPLLSVERVKFPQSLGLVLSSRSAQIMLLYRLSHALWRKKVPVLPMLISRIMQTLYAVDIDYKAQLGPGIVIVHGIGTVIGSESRIEGDCTLFHGVTLGDRGSSWIASPRPDGHPVMERGVIVGAGAKLLGPIRVGCFSVVGANSVVAEDVPPCSVVAGLPARVVSKNRRSVCRHFYNCGGAHSERQSTHEREP